MGVASLKLVEDVLKEANEQSGKVDRRSVLKALRSMLNRDNRTETFGIVTATFDGEGNNKAGQVHVYEMTPKGAIHSLLCPCTNSRRD